MSNSDNDLRPEEFAQAAAEAIQDAQARDFRDAARVLAAAEERQLFVSDRLCKAV